MASGSQFGLAEYGGSGKDGVHGQLTLQGGPRARSLTKNMMEAVEMSFDGKSCLEIAYVMFPKQLEEAKQRSIAENNPKKLQYMEHAYRKKVEGWLQRPEAQDYYRKIIVNRNAPAAVGKALKVLTKQLDSENEWIANKAANDILNKYYDLVMGTNSNEIVVRFEGMPEIGSPDQEEKDARPLRSKMRKAEPADEEPLDVVGEGGVVE